MSSLQGKSEGNPEKWVALLGRQDKPTDGVEDYCVFLGGALAKRGIELKRIRAPWAEIGWIGSLRQLRRESAAWKGKWILLQYTALSWSRRGFPFLLLFALRTLRTAGARVAVVFHEPHRQVQSSPRWIDRLRGVSQDYVIHRLYREADAAVFTVPLDTVNWLPEDDKKSAFIPIGANIPERSGHREAPTGTRTVVVFGVTEPPATRSEAEEIAAVMKNSNEAISNLRLVVLGRGAVGAQGYLAEALQNSNVELVVRGVLPAEEIACEFERADVLLFVRGAINPRRGSALAGVACGLPIVGYRNGELGGPLEYAGLECSPWRDRDSLVRNLVRVLSDPVRWTELHERNLEVQKNSFSWDRIAEQFRTVLAG